MASRKKLVSAITDELADTSSSLAGPLLKIKILASRLGNQDLVDWINKEMEGYELGEVPRYRMARTHVTCTMVRGYSSVDNQTFPIMFLDKKWLEYFQSFQCGEGLEALEHIAGGSMGKILSKSFGADFAAIINAHISREKPQRFSVHNIRMDVNISQVKNIVSNIRNKVLDLMLELEKGIKNVEGKDVENEVANQVINHFMTEIHITSSGTGNTINTGDRNNISVTNNISKGDVSALKQALRSHHVPEEDIEEIATIVSIEPYNEAAKSFGVRTNQWISKMMNKSLDGSWQVGIGAAGTLLAEGLKAYFGVHF